MQELNTVDKYEGCPEDIKKALSENKAIKGRFWDDDAEKAKEGLLNGYDSTGLSKLVYRATHGMWYRNFDPTYKKRSTKCVRTLMEAGVEIPVNTEIYVGSPAKEQRRLAISKMNRHKQIAAFKHTESIEDYNTIAQWDYAELLEPMEY